MKKVIEILYVDDEETNLLLFEKIFCRKFKVRTANSAMKGLEKLRSNPYIEIVISDMRMPELDGIEFIKLAKKEFPLIPCFILTGYDITKDISEALDQKLILKYFRKPLNNKEIEDSIIQIFN